MKNAMKANSPKQTMKLCIVTSVCNMRVNLGLLVCQGTMNLKPKHLLAYVIVMKRIITLKRLITLKDFLVLKFLITQDKCIEHHRNRNRNRKPVDHNHAVIRLCVRLSVPTDGTLGAVRLSGTSTSCKSRKH